MAEQRAFAEEVGDADIHVGRAALVRDIAARIGRALGVEGQVGIPWGSDIGRSEIGEQRIFAWTAIAVTAVALSTWVIRSRGKARAFAACGENSAGGVGSK
jgi:hypothetical protein